MSKLNSTSIKISEGEICVLNFKKIGGRAFVYEPLKGMHLVKLF